MSATNLFRYSFHMCFNVWQKHLGQRNLICVLMYGRGLCGQRNFVQVVSTSTDCNFSVDICLDLTLSSMLKPLQDKGGVHPAHKQFGRIAVPVFVRSSLKYICVSDFLLENYSLSTPVGAGPGEWSGVVDQGKAGERAHYCVTLIARQPRVCQNLVSVS